MNELIHFDSNNIATVPLPPSITRMSIFIENWRGMLAMKSILQSLEYGVRTRTQFLHTLRDFVYVYSFGDEMGDLTLNGFSYSEICDPGIIDLTFGKNGIGLVYQYYRQNRSSAKLNPIYVDVDNGAVQIFGFLISLNFNMNSNQTIPNFVSFTLRMRTLPPPQDFLYW